MSCTPCPQNQHVRTRSELLDSICVALGGREAELMILEEISSGCWNDLQQATAVASMMVEQLGMSEAMGVRSYRSEQSGGLLPQPRGIADSTAAEIDVAIRDIIEGQRQRCHDTLETWRDEYDTLVETLLEKKTIGLEQMKEIFGGREFKVQIAEEDSEGDVDEDDE